MDLLDQRPADVLARLRQAIARELGSTPSAEEHDLMAGLLKMLAAEHEQLAGPDEPDAYLLTDVGLAELVLLRALHASEEMPPQFVMAA